MSEYTKHTFTSGSILTSTILDEMDTQIEANSNIINELDKSYASLNGSVSNDFSAKTITATEIMENGATLSDKYASITGTTSNNFTANNITATSITASAITENGTLLSNKYLSQNGGMLNGNLKLSRAGYQTFFWMENYYNNNTNHIGIWTGTGEKGCMNFVVSEGNYTDVITSAKKTQMSLTQGALYPYSNKGASLGTSNNQWNNIYGTTIYGTTINGTTINENGTNISSKYQTIKNSLTVTEDGEGTNAFSGTLDSGNLFSTVGKGGIGTMLYNNAWYNFIRIRHRNGAGDGQNYGMTLYSVLTDKEASLYFAHESNGVWGNRHLVLDDKNYTSYAAQKSHTHSASDINSGTISTARLPIGTASTQVAAGNHTHNYAASSHTHTVSQITDISSNYAAISHTHSYLPLSGGTVTGRTVFSADLDGVSALVIGTASNTHVGRLTIYDSTHHYAVIKNNSLLTANRSLYIPNSTGTISVTSSDIRLKDNIQDSEINAIDYINKLPVKQFDWTYKGWEDKGHWNAGFIADELENIDEKLSIGKGGYDVDGEISPKTVDTFYLQGYLVKAIQELSKEIEQLKKENLELKEAITDGR